MEIGVHTLGPAGLLPKPLQLLAIAATAFCLSLGCKKGAGDENGGPAPRANELPKPAKEHDEQAIRGRLRFGSRPSHLRAENEPFEGTTLGNEGEDHRKYIAGHPASPQRAIWHFDELPPAAFPSDGAAVSAKMTFSLFRLANRASDAAVVTVRAVSHTCPQLEPLRDSASEWQWADERAHNNYRKRVAEYTAKGIALRGVRPGDNGWNAIDLLAEEYGYYEAQISTSLELTESNIPLPVGLFRNALKHKPEADVNDKAKRPLVSIFLKCETEGFLLGVVEPDLYLVGRPIAK